MHASGMLFRQKKSSSGLNGPYLQGGMIVLCQPLHALKLLQLSAWRCQHAPACCQAACNGHNSTLCLLCSCPQQTQSFTAG